jgi:hypothetical protein
MRRASGESVARLPRKENLRVRRNQFIGGIALLVLAALILLFQDTSASVPVAVTLTVVGITLVASSRRE